MRCVNPLINRHLAVLSLRAHWLPYDYYSMIAIAVDTVIYALA